MARLMEQHGDAKVTDLLQTLANLWRAAARERCLTTRARRGESNAREPQLSRRGIGTPSITNGEAAAGGALWADIALPDLLAS